MNYTPVELYNYAEQHSIEVLSLTTRKTECMSVIDDDGDCAIGINPFSLKSEADELVKLAHELGHCKTGSFYNLHSPLDIRTKHEYTADKWAIKKLIPLDELKTACNICTNRWELSEYFGVTESFMQKTLDFYNNWFEK